MGCPPFPCSSTNQHLERICHFHMIHFLTAAVCVLTENPGCRDQPFTILCRIWSVVSGPSIPADIFKSRQQPLPGACPIFQIKSVGMRAENSMRVREIRVAGHHLPQGVPRLAWSMLRATKCSLEGGCGGRRGKWMKSGLLSWFLSHFLSGLESCSPLCKPQDPYLCSEKLGQDAW